MNQILIKNMLKIFPAASLINLAWEVAHSPLYETALAMPVKEYSPMILTMSLKDGLWITLFYAISTILFKNTDILKNRKQLGTFVVMALTFSALDEKISLAMGRWEYAEAMPTPFGIGLTPLLELAITGVATLWCLQGEPLIHKPTKRLFVNNGTMLNRKNLNDRPTKTKNNAIISDSQL